MTLANAVAALLFTGLSLYALLGGADFGVGFWDLTAGGAKRGEKQRHFIEKAMAPVWEANHVWLIYALVVLFTCFPRVFAAVFSTLWIPLSLAVVGIMLRGSAYAFRKEMSTLQQARPFGAVFAASSVLTPFFLGTVAGGIASGRVPLGNAAGDPWSSWLNPTSFVGGVLAVLVTALLAALFLAHDAHAFGEPELEEAFRSRVLLASALTGAVAVVGIFVLAADEGSVFVQPSGGVTLFQGLRTQALPDLILSSAFGLATIWATWDRRYTLARVLGALAVLTVLWGWAFGQYPYMLNGVVTIEDAAGSDSALTAMLVASAVGAVVLVPSLLWLFRLMRKGTFFIDPSPATEPITGDVGPR